MSAWSQPDLIFLNLRGENNYSKGMVGTTYSSFASIFKTSRIACAGCGVDLLAVGTGHTAGAASCALSPLA